MVVGQHRPELFREDRRRELVRTFFHPAYLVENWVEGMGHQLTAPRANFGPPMESANDIVVLDSDGEEVESTPAPARNPMLPPLKYTLQNYKRNARRGRPRIRRFRSRGAASAAGAAAPARVGGTVMTQEDRTRQFLNDDALDFDSF